MVRKVNFSHRDREAQSILRIFFLVICLVFSGLIFSQEKEEAPVPIAPERNDSNLNAEQIIELYKPALISIWYHTDNYYSYSSYETKDTTLLNGSGFIFSEDGMVGTNFHVVDGIDSLIVKTSDGGFYDADLLMVDEKNDVAIIKLKNIN